jgi:hypothetical protein
MTPVQHSRKCHFRYLEDYLPGMPHLVLYDVRPYLSERTFQEPGHSGPFGMRSEIGMATFTNCERFKKFMPTDTWWPPNEIWNQLFFGNPAVNAGPGGYLSDVDRRYGKPVGIEDFCVKAQLLSFETMKAMLEGWLDRSNKEASCISMWMSQSAYPAMVWQPYDYYFDLTGSYWGAKSACKPGKLVSDLHYAGPPPSGSRIPSGSWSADPLGVKIAPPRSRQCVPQRRLTAVLPPRGSPSIGYACRSSSGSSKTPR